MREGGVSVSGLTRTSAWVNPKELSFEFDSPESKSLIFKTRSRNRVNP